jgi:hypothetical protein
MSDSMDAEACRSCGLPLDGHDRHVRFELPDPVSETNRIDTAGAWLSHADANSSVMMQIPGLGAFVRALLPVRLSGGYSVTFGGTAPDLADVLEQEWPHEGILRSLPA